ncbi:helix-turn-helix transcriptional regulator [Streptomyces sp. NBC_00841]|uniref:helix-turn-helix transcriptional regulator n=1 Tax=Streptomyces sp. NBC_00841 TaxID=2975847 RepID=UPI002DDA853F|nr:helix-turn-helix transcriptional regulator [Streptomyces sp. NBC_00841]WRZ96692.1 helix-turn-helix transcriptional regulator [Streptomyces sp. NBC_00841]
MTDADVMPEAEWEGLGVPHFDRRVYLEALRHPDAGVTGWAEGLGAEPGRVRGAAERLLDLGLLRRTVEGRPRLEPVDPRLAMRAAVRQRQERVDRFAATAGELAEELSVVYEHGRLRARPSRILEVIEGTGAAAARVAELLAGAEWEACGIDAPPYVTASGNGAGNGAEHRLLNRGVRFRTLYAAECLDVPEKLSSVLAAIGCGEEARVLPAAPLKLLLVDGRTALLPLTGSEGSSRHRSVVVHGSTLTDALQALFDTLWRQGAPLRARGKMPDQTLAQKEGLTAAEQYLVELLASGITDEAIARHLGVTARTLRRRIRDLHDRLGSSGRFQAGVRAAQRGWL